ncbi:hypothetical protein ACJX0J_035391, partial [Zea mays]
VLGHVCYHIIAAGLNGYMAIVTNLNSPVNKWKCWYYVSRTLRLLWEDFITVDGFVMLPQVMWLTFVPFIHNSLLHGIISGSLDVADVAM